MIKKIFEFIWVGLVFCVIFVIAYSSYQTVVTKFVPEKSKIYRTIASELFRGNEKTTKNR